MAQLDLFKDSSLGLKGQTPKSREGSSRDSQLHVQTGNRGLSIKPELSELDLDGKKPSTYRDNAPEGASF